MKKSPIPMKSFFSSAYIIGKEAANAIIRTSGRRLVSTCPDAVTDMVVLRIKWIP
jgi:hypothetical protein